MGSNRNSPSNRDIILKIIFIDLFRFTINAELTVKCVRNQYLLLCCMKTTDYYRLQRSGPSVLVAGSSSLVRDVAVVNSPGVEPLELPAMRSRQDRSVFTTLIGRGMSRLGSHWSRGL